MHQSSSSMHGWSFFADPPLSKHARKPRFLFSLLASISLKYASLFHPSFFCIFLLSYNNIKVNTIIFVYHCNNYYSFHIILRWFKAFLIFV